MITITPNSEAVGCTSANSAEFESEICSTFATGESATTLLHIRIIPASFWKGLADCDSGRVVDMGRALEDEPPKSGN